LGIIFNHFCLINCPAILLSLEMVKILQFIAGTLVSINFLPQRPQSVCKEPQRMDF